MVTLLLGTNPYPFMRLLEAVDAWSVDNGMSVVAQTGHTPINTVTNIKCFDFVEHSQILQWIKQSDFVITQGGFGSIRDCVAERKPVIAAPRSQELGECADNQDELVRALESEGKVIALYDMRDLSEAIRKARAYEYSSGLDNSLSINLSSLLKKYLQE